MRVQIQRLEGATPAIVVEIEDRDAAAIEKRGLTLGPVNIVGNEDGPPEATATDYLARRVAAAALHDEWGMDASNVMSDRMIAYIPRYAYAVEPEKAVMNAHFEQMAQAVRDALAADGFKVEGAVKPAAAPPKAKATKVKP